MNSTKELNNSADTLLGLVVAHGSVEGVMSAIAGGIQVKKNNTAFYHIQKAIGHYKEIEKHVSALAELGIVLLPIDSSTEIYVKRGIEKFGVPLKDLCGSKSFEHLGVEVWQSHM